MNLRKKHKSKLATSSSDKPGKASAEPVTSGPVTHRTVAEHRNEIIGRARKYIYPTHTRRHIVMVSISLLVTAISIFLVVCGVLLYKFNNTSTFIYRVTQVVPFPIAKVGNRYVAYENYLFQVRHYTHYYHYRTQEPVDFSTKSGRDQLDHYEHQALTQVVDQLYIKQLAKENGVTVTSQDVNERLAVAKSRLGGNEQQFESVLESFWGWSISDYKRELSQEILQEKVASKLDTTTHATANSVLAQLKAGADFGTLAAKYSADKSTSASGGQYPEVITEQNTDLAPQLKAAAFELAPGQTSGIIDTGYSLEILKLISKDSSGIKLAHIQLNLAPISQFIKPLEAKNPPHYFITLPKD